MGQPGRYPALDRVAGRTVRAEHAGVDFRIVMARVAGRADRGEVGVGVTIGAAHAGVTALQWEDMMVEWLQLPMAGHAVGAVLGCVLVDESGVDLAVAQLAARQREGVARRPRVVAVAAGEAAAAGPRLVPD